jgi:copper(I)-binding protein
MIVGLCVLGLPAHAIEQRPQEQPAQTTAAVTVRDAWARATAPGMTVGAVYLTLQGGAVADRLVGAATARAEMTQIHVVTEDGGMARMRETAAVDVPAGQRVQLAPQGTHLMLMGLGRSLSGGESFPLTLHFERAGKREIQVRVVAPGDSPPASH